MADGTLRMTFDIDPMQAKDAFSLFAAPGTPVAIAALKTGYAAVGTTTGDTLVVEQGGKSEIGPLCRWLVMRCGEPEFWEFLNSEFPNGPAIHSEPDASEFVKELLGASSRKEVDTVLGAESLMHSDIRLPYQRWLVRRQG